MRLGGTRQIAGNLQDNDILTNEDAGLARELARGLN
jgi:hypothetical protein